MKTQFLWSTRFIVSASTECQATAEVWAELYRCPRVSKSFGVTPPLPTGPVHTSLTQSILWPPMGETQSLGGLTRSHLNLRRDGGKSLPDEHSATAHTIISRLPEFLIQCGEEVMKIVIDFLVKICITMVTPNLR